MTISVSAVLSATPITDLDSDGVVDPGDTLRFTATVTNTSNASETLTGVQFAQILDGMTLSGTVNVSPIALNDSFTAVGNTLLIVGGTNGTGNPASVVSGSLFDNDVEFSGDTFVLASFTPAANGTVAVNNDGTFTYITDAGFTGTDTFTYTIRDDGLDGVAGNADDLSSVGTVSITVTDQVWYVEESAVGGDGTSGNPFGTVTDAGAVSGANDYVYVEGNAGGTIALDAGERLIGTGSALVVGGFTLAAAAGGGGNSSIAANSAGFAVTLGTNNTIIGIDIVNTAGGALTGTGFGTLTVSDVALDASGQALSLTTGAIHASSTGFNSTDSDGGTNNVSLTGVTGSLALGTGALSGATGIGFLVNGGAGDIDYNGTISKSSDGRAIDVQNHTSGTVSFDNDVTSTGSSDGVLLNNNGGTTFAFTDTLTINTSASGTTGFAATGGGTVTATGTGNTINSGAGTALNVVNTNIGAADLNFVSISANGGSAGIVLNNTGTTAGTHGGLTVTGTGVTDGSGGTIQNTTGRGASFIDAIEIKLSNMNFTNAGTSDLDATNGGLSTGDNLATNAAIHLVTVTNATLDNLNITGGAEQGINGNNVTNFNLLNSSITDVGNEADEDSIHFYNMAGSSSIVNTTMNSTVVPPNSTGGDDHLNLQMQSGNLDLTISGGSATNANRGSGYLFGIRGTAVANLNLDGVSSTNNFSGGIVADAFDTATMNLRVNASTSMGSNDQLSVSAGDNSRVDLEATGNILRSLTTGDFVVVNLLGSAFDNGYIFDARIHNNTISVANGLTTDGILVFNAGGGTMNTAITDNTIIYAGTQRGILLQAGQDGSGITRATITGNNIDIQLDGVGNAVAGILAQTAITGPGNTSSLNLNLGGAGALANVFTHSLGGGMAGGDIRVRQRNDGTFSLDGYGGAPTDTAAVIAYLAGRNAVVSPSTATADSTGFSGGASPVFITVGVSAASVTEDGATNLIYTFTRNGSTASSLVADFAITGTASPSSDYAVTGATSFNTGTGLGTVTFSAGSATAAITIDPTADGTAEAGESVVVDAGNSATANGAFARALITNDDGPLFLLATSPGDDHGGDSIAPPAPTPGSTGPVVVDDGVLSQAELALIVDAAIARWEAAGASPEQLAAMRAVAVSVTNLGGLQLGASTLGTIVLDDNAAGWSWFVDATPGDDAEYLGSGTQLAAVDALGQAGTRIDLLSVVMHELGHQIGLGDTLAAGDADALMYALIHAGERRLPGAGEAAGAVPHGDGGPQYIGAPISVATLPAGKSFTVQFDAVVDPQANQPIDDPVNQATVTWTGPSGGSQPSNGVTTDLDSLTLGSTIFLDANKDGDFDAGEGRSGVTLTLYADANGSGVLDGAELTTVIATTTSGALGAYSFVNLAPGDYVVSVDAANFTGGGQLVGKVNTAGGTDPDDNVDNDDNGIAGPGGTVISAPIRLDYNQEPTAGVGNDTNNTLDFGFFTPNAAPTAGSLAGDTATFTEGGGTVLLDVGSNATIADDQANFNTGTLTVAFGAGTVAAEDQLVITATGGVTFTATTVSVSGTQIATYIGGGAGGSALVFTFDADATPAAVQALVRALGYSNSAGDVPTAGSRTIGWTLVDGGGTDGGAGADTLTFNSAVDVVAVNDTPVVAVAASVSSTEQVAGTIDAAATIADAELGARGDYAGSALTVARSGGAVAEDLLSFGPSGAFTVNGANLEAGGLVFATFAGGNGTALVITFTGSGTPATQALVDAVAQSLQYTNTSDTPPASIQMVYSFDDGAPVNAGQGGVGSPTGTDTITINITDTPENAAPVVDLDADDSVGTGNDFASAYTEGGAAAAISDTDVEITDTDVGDDIVSATITITNPETGDLLTVGTLPGTVTVDPGSTDTTVVLVAAPGTSAADFEAAIEAVTFSNTGDNPTDGGTNLSRSITVVVNDGVSASAAATATVTVTDLNDAPAGTSSTITAIEDTFRLLGAADLGFSDVDGTFASVTLSAVTGGGIYFDADGTAGAGTPVLATLPQTYTAQDLLDGKVSFRAAANANGAALGTITFAVTDDDGATDATPNTLTVNVTSVPDAPVAQPDAVATPENAIGTGSLFANNGSGPDSDGDGDTFTISEVDGSAANIGVPLTLASGALLTVNANGSYSYNPNGQFNRLTDNTSGAVNTSTVGDTFQYTLSGGNTVTVTVTVNGVAGAGDWLMGDGTGNVITGTPGPDLFVVGQGGNDTIDGLAGNDIVYFGGALTDADNVTGGADTDTIALQGDYSGGLVLDGGVTGIERLSLVAGNNTSFGDPGTNLYDYVIATHDANFAPGVQARINASALLAGEDFTFDGSAETDGKFVVYGGQGTDDLTGGLGNDIFFFADGGRFAAGDKVDGGGGYDGMFLRGNYTIDFTDPGYIGALAGLENLTLSSASDERYARGGTEFDYDLTWDDGLLGSGQTITINGALLLASETMAFDGSGEADGHFKLYGGAAADTLTGGGGNDLLYGGGGSDALAGGAGNDTFRYQEVGNSTTGAGNFDAISGFTHLGDKLDFNPIDANSLANGNQNFSFIGSSAFSGTGSSSAGQLRVEQIDALNNIWKAEGDVNGDGSADLYIQITVDAGQPLTSADFVV